MVMASSPRDTASRASLLASMPVILIPVRFDALTAARTPMAISSLKQKTASICGWAWRMFSITPRATARSYFPLCWATILMPGYLGHTSADPFFRSSEEAAPGMPSMTTTFPLPPSALATHSAPSRPITTLSVPMCEVTLAPGTPRCSVTTGIPASAALFRTAAAPSWVALMMITSTFFWIRSSTSAICFSSLSSAFRMVASIPWALASSRTPSAMAL